jgi:cytochrome bd-type quinol oxidase subunit 2
MVEELFKGNVKAKYRVARPMEKVAFFIGGFALLLCWGLIVMYFSQGNMRAHENYWGQSVGTISFTAVCLVGTYAYLIALWRHWISHIIGSHIHRA